MNSRFRTANEHAPLRSESHRSTAKSKLRERHHLRDKVPEMDTEFHRDMASNVKGDQEFFTKYHNRTK